MKSAKKMNEKKIYVLRSKCERFTKIGVSYHVPSRVDNICISERTNFYLVYESHYIDVKEALIVEAAVCEEFKSGRYKGKEWLTAHPLDVIKFVISKIGYRQKFEFEIEDLGKYDVWIESNRRYNSLSYEQPNGVRITPDYCALVRFVHNSKFVVLGFSNIGDANNFAQENRHNIRATPVITNLLFGLSYKDWMAQKMEAHEKYILI